MASVFKRNGKGSYLIAYYDQNGHRRERSARTTDKATAQRIAAKLEADVALRREGIIDAKADRMAREARRPIAEHLDEFIENLNARGVTAKQTSQLFTRARKVLAQCNTNTIADITPHGVQTAIGATRDNGASLQTCNHILRAIKQFTRWLARDGRIVTDPIFHLRTTNAETDRRYTRRSLTDDELGWLIRAAETGPDLMGICGMHRAISYHIAIGTGFRVSELKSLTRDSFDLDAEPPTIAVSAAYSKRRHRDVQPIGRTLGEMLRPWLADKPRGEPVLYLPQRTARMIQKDLRRARATWVREASDGQERRLRLKSDFLSIMDHEGRVCDYHALRHTYITRLVSSGASVKVCQELARHSSPALTIGRYAHTRLHDLRSALDNLPDVGGGDRTREGVALRATGTHNSRAYGCDDVSRAHPQIPQQMGCFSQRDSATTAWPMVPHSEAQNLQ